MCKEIRGCDPYKEKKETGNINPLYERLDAGFFLKRLSGSNYMHIFKLRKTMLKELKEQCFIH
jgi:hypothetical protein